MSTRVLGIDPGSETTGWGVIEGDERRYKLVAFGCVRAASSAQPFAERLLKISEGLEQVIARWQPAVCSIEETFFAANVKSALKLGHARGVAILAAARARLAVHEYSARLIKQTVVGYGAAEKHQVQEMVRLLLKLSAPPQPHDAADALAVAICHLHHVGVSNRIVAAEAQVKIRPSSSIARRRAPRRG